MNLQLLNEATGEDTSKKSRNKDKYDIDGDDEVIKGHTK